MKKLQIPLLVWVVVALVLMGLLPLAISYFQLETQKDALGEQVELTHVVASRAAAAEVDAYLEGMLVLARSIASHPVLLDSPRSPVAQELLRGTLVAQPAAVVAGVFNARGEDVVMVRRRDMKNEIEALYDPGAERLAERLLRRWMSRPCPVLRSDAAGRFAAF